MAFLEIIILVLSLVHLGSFQQYPIVVDGTLSDNEWPAPLSGSIGPVSWFVSLGLSDSTKVFLGATWGGEFTNDTTDYIAMAYMFNPDPKNTTASLTTGSDSILCNGANTSIAVRVNRYVCMKVFGTMEYYRWNTSSSSWSLNTTASIAYSRSPSNSSFEFTVPLESVGFENGMLFYGTMYTSTGSGKSSSRYHGLLLSTSSTNIPLSSKIYENTYPFSLEGATWVDPTNWLRGFTALDTTQEYLSSNALVTVRANITTTNVHVANLAIYRLTQLNVKDYLLKIGKGGSYTSYIYLGNPSSLNTINNGTVEVVAPAVFLSNLSPITGNIRFSGSGSIDNPNGTVQVGDKLEIVDHVSLSGYVNYNSNSTLYYKSVPASFQNTQEWPSFVPPNSLGSYIPQNVVISNCSMIVYLLNNQTIVTTNLTIRNSSVSSIIDQPNMAQSIQVYGTLQVINSSQLALSTDLFVTGQILVDSTSSIVCTLPVLITSQNQSWIPLVNINYTINSTQNQLNSNDTIQLAPNQSAIVNIGSGFTTPIWTLQNGSLQCNNSLQCVFDSGDFTNQTIQVAVQATHTSGCLSTFQFYVHGNTITPSVTPSPSPTSSTTPSSPTLPTPSSTPSPTISGPTPSISPSSNTTGTDNSSGPHHSAGGSNLPLIIGLCIGLFFLVAMIAFAFLLIHKRKKAKDTKEYDTELNETDNSSSQPSVVSLESRSSQSLRISSRDFNKEWEIPFTEITLGPELGRGAFGVVYKSRWRNTDCVVKQLDIKKNDQDSIDQFLKEASNVKNLRNHPNVCTVFGVCTNPEHPICIVMEYLPDGSLDRLVYRKDGVTDPHTVVQFAKDIASGMSHLHKENVLHCDLACRNLLMTAKGKDKYQIKIADFGLSRVTDKDTYNATTTTGFPVRWTAPETLRTGKISRASDVWSFGVVLWEMIEGKRPYPDKTNPEVIKAVCDLGYRLPKPDRIKLPEEFYQLMLKCWEELPENRPSFDQLYASLVEIEQSFYEEEVKQIKPHDSNVNSDTYHTSDVKSNSPTQEEYN